jgi:dipeptide/tripeptide permease
MTRLVFNAKKLMSYEPVRKSSIEAAEPVAAPKSTISRIRGGFGHFFYSVMNGFKSLESCPRELYVNFVLKFFESYSYFALSQILVIYLHTEFGASDLEAGTAYGTWGLAITLFGLTFSWINDYLGVRGSLLIGFPLSALATFIIASTSSKTVLYFALFCLLPLGNSMGIPMLTVGIRRYTNVHNRGFAFGLYYSVMNIAAFVSGPIVDVFNIALSGGVVFGGRHWSGNRLVILTATLTSICSFLVTYFSLREVRVVDDASARVSPAATSTTTVAGQKRISPVVGNALHANATLTTSAASREIELRTHSNILTHGGGPHFTILGDDSDEEDSVSADDDNYENHDRVVAELSHSPLRVTTYGHSSAAGDNNAPITAAPVRVRAPVPNREDTLSDDDYRSCASDEESLTVKKSSPSPLPGTANESNNNNNKIDIQGEITLGGSTKLHVPLLESSSTALGEEEVKEGDDIRDRHTYCIRDDDEIYRPRWATLCDDSEDGMHSTSPLHHHHSPVTEGDVSTDSPHRAGMKNNYENKTDRGDDVLIASSNQQSSGGLQEYTPTKESLWVIIKQIFYSATFWRFTAFSLLLINLKTIFRHLDATLPTYLIRCFGDDVPKGTIYSINPFMIIFLTPVVAAVTTEYAHFDMIKYGSYLTALSPFFLAGSTSIWAACCMITVLTLGEAIWSPRTYDYTMSIAPEVR